MIDLSVYYKLKKKYNLDNEFDYKEEDHLRAPKNSKDENGKGIGGRWVTVDDIANKDEPQIKKAIEEQLEETNNEITDDLSINRKKKEESKSESTNDNNGGNSKTDFEVKKDKPRNEPLYIHGNGIKKSATESQAFTKAYTRLSRAIMQGSDNEEIYKIFCEEIDGIQADRFQRGSGFIKNKISERLISSSKELRVAIHAQAISELQEHLGKEFGIDDDGIQHCFNCLFGKDFVEKGYTNGEKSDMIDSWTRFAEYIRPHVANMIDNMSAEGKTPIFWSKISEQDQTRMDEENITIANATMIDYCLSLDKVFPNWSGEGDGTFSNYKLQDFWGILSRMYAEEVCSDVNLRSVDFAYPEGISNADDIAGDLFYSDEFPVILGESKVSRIVFRPSTPDFHEKELYSVPIADIKRIYRQDRNIADAYSRLVERIQCIQDEEDYETYDIEPKRINNRRNRKRGR